ncbi:MAG: cytochrome c, partial [Halioglobus sp.]|nr:cytochrome c [Halioglobus sp.]
MLAAALYFFIASGGPEDPFVADYEQHCASCHGAGLEGVPGKGGGFLATDLAHGDSVADLGKSIARGLPDRGMPGFADSLSAEEIRGLAIYIAERRVDRVFTD